jgi:hypothetical protein
VVGALILVGSLWVGALRATQIKDREAPTTRRIYEMEARYRIRRVKPQAQTSKRFCAAFSKSGLFISGIYPR